MEVYRYDHLIIRDSILSDIDFLKDKLRKSDVDEVWASNHFTPENALKTGYELSTPHWTVIYKGEPIAMFGVNMLITPVGAVDSKVGIVWLLGTDKLGKIEKTFMKCSKKFISIMLSFCPVLINIVDIRNTASIKWLKYLGAIFNDKEIPILDGKFYRFEIRSDKYV